MRQNWRMSLKALNSAAAQTKTSGPPGQITDRAAEPEIFVSRVHTFWPLLTFAFRGQGDPSLLGLSAHGALRAAFPDQVFGPVQALPARLGMASREPRVRTLLLGGLSAAALLLAGFGLFGLLGLLGSLGHVELDRELLELQLLPLRERVLGLDVERADRRLYAGNVDAERARVDADRHLERAETRLHGEREVAGTEIALVSLRESQVTAPMVAGANRKR